MVATLNEDKVDIIVVCSPEERTSEAYQEFWASLKQGTYQAG
jgi:hypothetical protein